MVTVSMTLPAAWWWCAGSRSRAMSLSRWRGATCTSSRRRRHPTAGSATALAMTAAGVTAREPTIAGAARCGDWAPPPPGAPPRPSGTSRSPGSTPARGSAPSGRTPWRSPRSAPPRCSTYRPATRPRSACSPAAVSVIGEPPASAAWPWPAPRLSYANAAIAEAVIVAGARLGEDAVLRNGLRMLEWLLAVETRNGHLSVVPAGGWGRGEAPSWLRPAADRGRRAGRRVRARGDGDRRL